MARRRIGRRSRYKNRRQPDEEKLNHSASKNRSIAQAIQHPSAETLTPDILQSLQQTHGNQFTAQLVQRQVYGDSATNQTDLKALIPIDKFIEYVEQVEKAYPKDTPEQILTRIRQEYYSGLAFTRLIPNAPHHERKKSYSYYGGQTTTLEPRKMSSSKVEKEAYSHLTAHADENAKGDNPSPYIVMPDKTRVDVGHMLLGLDALLHPGTSAPFSSYDVPEIDPSSWVADLGIGAVWAEIHERTGEPPDNAPKKLSSSNIDEYYEMSAPEEDLLGDVDSFGMHEQWQEQADQSLSQVLRAYYLGTSTQPEKGIDKRWQTFCKANGLAYTLSGSKIEWDENSRKEYIERLNEFNDLFSEGSFWSFVGALGEWTQKEQDWKYTEYVLDKFLDWVAEHLQNELAAEK